MGSKKFNTK